MTDSLDYRGYKIKIEQDSDPQNPRTDSDPMGTMVCFHNRYDLGDKHDYRTADYSNWQELEQAIIEREGDCIILPLYLYDHSGLRIKIGSFAGLLPQGHAEFDSGRVGLIYLTKKKAIAEYGKKKFTKTIQEKAINYLASEIDTYDDYLSGNVWGYVVEDKAGNTIDSCWGFYGDTEYPIKEAKSVIDYRIKEEREKHAARLKAQIKNRVFLDHRTACAA